ncbi:MAG TPA: hypothetical protein VGW10_06105, partial [Solirubrobacteraceae bacterium]|nr:hypothetical protein [Solirubrobacteraceae bacterium]
KSRTDRVAGNETAPGTPNLGFDWSERCTQNPDGTWSCPHPQRECTPRPGPDGTFECWRERTTISDPDYRRMKAQVNNDAHGWNSPEFAPYAESEPPEIDKIKGYYTHDDNEHSAALGYRMTVPISMANDYHGYIVSYREFQRGDHYRKALTGWGPHSSDYMATRLVKLGRLMKNPSLRLDKTIRGAPSKDGIADPDADSPAFLAKTEADVGQNEVRAAAIGEAATALVTAYEASLPDDGGAEASAVREPVDVQRFDLASFEWVGGSNYTDNPDVRVQRRVDGRWVDAADMTGEVVTTIRYPDGSEEPGAPLAYRAGGMKWHWTAHFEPFVSRFGMPGADRATPPGTYRFLVDGRRRAGGKTVDYELTSKEFAVGAWAGITVEDVRREADGRVAFRGRPAPARRHPLQPEREPGRPDRGPDRAGADRLPRLVREDAARARGVHHRDAPLLARPERAGRPVAVRALLHRVLVPAVAGRRRRLPRDRDVRQGQPDAPDRGGALGRPLGDADRAAEGRGGVRLPGRRAGRVGQLQRGPLGSGRGGDAAGGLQRARDRRRDAARDGDRAAACGRRRASGAGRGRAGRDRPGIRARAAGRPERVRAALAQRHV